MDKELLAWQITLASVSTEAKEIIDNYKKEFPGITTYMEDTDQLCPKERVCANTDGQEKMAAGY